MPERQVAQKEQVVTQEEFVKRWRYHVAGMALYGTCPEATGPAGRAFRAFEIPAAVEKMLANMWQDAQQSPPLPPPAPPTTPPPNNKPLNQPAAAPAQQRR